MPPTPLPSAVAHPVIAGVSALTVGGGPACVPLDDLRADALRLSELGAGAFAYVPGGDESVVLAVLTDTLLISDAVLARVVGDYATRIAGTSSFCDPETALLDVQWQVTLLGYDVRVLDGPAGVSRPDSPEGARRRRSGLVASMSVNLGDRLRGPLVAVSEILDVTDSLAAAGADTTALDLQRSPGGDDIGVLGVPTAGLVGAYGVDGALDVLEFSRSVRSEVQAARRMPDTAILDRLQIALPVLLGTTEDPDRAARAERLLRLLGVKSLLGEPLRLAVAPIGERGQRRAKALRTAVGDDVELRVVDPCGTADALRKEGSWADAIVVIGGVLDEVPGFAVSGRPVLVDLSGEDVLALLTRADRTEDRDALLRRTVERSDRILVRDGGQRDLVLGLLAGVGRVNDLVYDADPSLRDLVAVEDRMVELERFALRPCLAADRGDAPAAAAPGRPSDVAVSIQYLREGGVRNVAEKAVGRVRRVVAERKGN